jgi:YHS domain-containing protein
MKSAIAIFVIVLLIGLSGTTDAFAQCSGCKDKTHMLDSEVKGISDVHADSVQTLCPVMGTKINKDLYVDHNGQRVYVCCKPCIDAIKKNPEKYIKKLEKDGIKLERTPITQEKCPVSGKSIDKDVYSDHKGERIYFHDNACKAAFEKNPEKYMKE